MQLNSIGMTLGLVIVAGGAVAARAGSESASRLSARDEIVGSREVRLPAAVVFAKPPTIAEVLDLILGEGSADKRGLTSSAAGTKTDALPSGSEEARVAGILRNRTPHADRANRIATALVREGRRANIGSALLVGVLLTENPDLEPRATSRVGARGLMQVMPFHAGKWNCPSADLFDINANICHGVQILADNLRHSRDLPAALQRYNGCVRGTNTPDCYLYASKVYRNARRSAAGPDGKVTEATPFAALNPRFKAPARSPARKGNIVLPKELLVD